MQAALISQFSIKYALGMPMATTCPLQRFASVEEIANTTVYYCSPLASATNGAAIRVEGGLIRSIL